MFISLQISLALLFLITSSLQLTNPYQEFAQQTQLPLLKQQKQQYFTQKPEINEGKTPPKIVFENIMSYPTAGEEDYIILRNIGGQIANLTGWQLIDSNKYQVYEFGIDSCEQDDQILPQKTMQINPQTHENPCGLPFGISAKDELILMDHEGKIQANISWETSEQGTYFRRINDGFVVLQKQFTILEILEQIPDFSIFLRVLKETGLVEFLDNALNPNFEGVAIPAPPSPDYLIQFPWWFGFQTDRSMAPPPSSPPPPPPAPPMGSIPNLGPYTVFAPTNDAFRNLLNVLNKGQKMPMEIFLRMPEIKNITSYHIAYGNYTTDYMFNNTGIQSSLGPEIVVINDPNQSEGFVSLHDSCIDKPTSGVTCKQQVEFDKCWEPFLTSAVSAGWQGGFCEKTCGRCTCDVEKGGMCASVLHPDIVAANGIVHGISRVMFPPPVFSQNIEESQFGPMDIFPIQVPPIVIPEILVTKSAKQTSQDLQGPSQEGIFAKSAVQQVLSLPSFNVTISRVYNN